MVGSLSETEEIVQETFIELLVTGPESINNQRSWLTKVAINKAINHLKLAYKKREIYPGVWLPDEIPDSLMDWNQIPDNKSLEEQIINSESLTTSFLLLAESLSPEQRSIYILKDIFDYSFDEISNIINKEASTCRKTFQRAKEALRKLDNKFSPPPENAKEKILKFFDGIKSGDTTAIKSLLSTTPELFGDGGGKVRAAGHITGQDDVIKFMLQIGASGIFHSPFFKIEFHKVNARPGIIISEKSKNGTWIFHTILSFEFFEGKIACIYGMRNPERLATLLSPK